MFIGGKAMKIGDFEKKGNLVRFYLVDDNDNDYWGDDWDDKPYEHNAGPIYEEYVKGYRDIVFPFGYTVLEPQEDWHYDGNSPWSKEDMKNRRVPCIVALEDAKEYYFDPDAIFEEVLANDRTVRFYFGDSMKPSGIIERYKKKKEENETKK